MKIVRSLILAILGSIIVFIFGCGDDGRSFAYYLKAHEKAERENIKELSEYFEDFLDKNYPKVPDDEQLRQYAQQLIDHQFIAIDSITKQKGVAYYESAKLNLDFRDWQTNILYPDGKHFEIIGQYIGKQPNDTLLRDYLNAYKTNGDLTTTGMLDYIVDKASEKELRNEMFRFLFNIEFFVPQLYNQARTPR